MKKLKLSNGGYTLVDDEWFEMLSKLKWYKNFTGKSKTPYVFTRIDGKQYPLHRVICDTSLLVDHVNRDTLDNTSLNLRQATVQQNNFNVPKKSGSIHSQYKGVTRDRGKWKAFARFNKEYFHLGVFDTEKEAARRYDEFAKKHHKEFACLNFPE